MLYNIYAGLGGGFGGYQYQYTAEFSSYQEAEDEAIQCAIEDYESYEGLHGILSYGDIKEEYCEENEISEDNLTDKDYEEIDSMYREEIESWISYLVTTVEEDPDHDRFIGW